MPVPGSIVIVGGGLAATRTIEGLRRLGVKSTVTLISAEDHLPYDRPPLSKTFLRGERTNISLRQDWDELGVSLRLGCRASGIDVVERKVLLQDGGSVRYEALVVATGVHPRRYPELEGDGVHTLRTLEDSRELADDIRKAGRLTIVGAGLIGCEVAASARALGAEVTVIEMLSAPLINVLGNKVAGLVATAHERAGVDLRCGTAILEVRGRGQDRHLLLSDGTTVPAPTVLLAMGAQPTVEWLHDSGLDIDNGVTCDATGRTSVPGIWAAGDVALWQHPDTPVQRNEHWTSAADQGLTVASGLAGKPHSIDTLPYFWSDQYNLKLQVLGFPGQSDDVEVLPVSLDGTRCVAVYGREGMASAIVGINAPKWVMRMRSVLTRPVSYEAALTAVSEV